MRVRINKTPPQNGLSVEGGKYETLSSDGINLRGNYHEQGGTMVSSNGELVEAEKNEPIYTGSDGSNYVFGNVANPFTGKLFKNESRPLLKEKGDAEKRLSKANDVIQNADPHSKFGSLDFNTGQVQMDAAQIEVSGLKNDLDKLAGIQEGLLQMAKSTGVDPKELGRNMKKNGGKLKVRMTGTPVADDGKKLPSFLSGAFDTPPPFPWLNNKPAAANPVAAAQATAPIQPPQPQPILNDIVTQPNTLGVSGSLAVRHNNPGNLKFSPWMEQYGATKGERARGDNDGTYFAKFPDIQSGQSAMRNLILTGKPYRGKTVEQAIKTWTNNAPYKSIPDSIRSKKISELSPDEQGLLLDTITRGEDNKSYNWSDVPGGGAGQSTRPSGSGTSQLLGNPNAQSYNPQYEFQELSPEAFDRMRQQQNFDVTPLDTMGVQPLTVDSRPYAQPMNINPNTGQQGAQRPRNNTLNPLDYLGEIAAILDTPDYVEGQQYNPILMSPYRVSFQDQINQNTSDFNALTRTMANNPEALATLAGQKYQQDQAVLANEFRANQGVQNQILNQNNQIQNQAQLTNLQFSQEQADRQAQARAVTEQNRRNALNSISDKYQQNRRYNNERQSQFDSQQMLSNMYGNLTPNYSFDQQGNVIFNDNGGYQFNYGGYGNNDKSAYYRYQAEQEQLKKQAKKDAARNVSKAAFGHKFQ